VSDELIGQFSPESFSKWCWKQFNRFTPDLHAASDAGGFAQAEIVGYVQTLPDGDANRPLLVMAIHAGDQINERSSRRRQFEFARKQLQAAIDKPPAKVKGLFTQGLFAFYDDAGAFRLSLVSGRAEGKRLVYSDFKRQSFFVTRDRNKTFRARMKSPFGTYQDLTAAFSVEALTKEFYNSLFTWYERAQTASTVWFPNDLVKDKKAGEVKSDQLIRLITRLMFVWFIRQKDLVPKQLFEPTDLTQILKDFDPFSSEQNQFYRAILQNLFFATLNCEIGERRFAPETGDQDKEHLGIKMLFRYSKEFACSPEQVMALFKKAPFLNGGLFECLDRKRDDSPRSPVLYYDGFSRKQEKRARIPNNFFFDNQGLITLFARYDFTMDENAPNDADVALDPELLGKVFENLLGAYNPETRETARKQSGSFYTPREIVNYMVNESLVAHLRTQAHEVEESAIRLLLGDENLPDFTEAVRRKLVEALYHCRILDPACGSGAFPMGLLLKMVHVLQRLDEKNAIWHEVVMEETEKALTEADSLDEDEKKSQLERITGTFERSINEPDYARKLYLIENCIFGVDIQEIAVQIAKLRAFITLVCDQKPDPANVAGNYGMLPLPNLETKFVAANSLIGLSSAFADELKPADGKSRLDDPALESLRAELAEVRHRHFRARTAPDKNVCRKLDRELRGKIKSRLIEIASKPNTAKIAFCQTEIESLQGRRKAVEKEDWQDVVRSTPAQINLFEESPPVVQTTLRVDVNKEQRDNLDYEISRNTRAIQAEENRAKNKSAFQKEAERLAAWDPYDQNASSHFFDPEWMFGFKGGFDIVIGNPPYKILTKKNTDSHFLAHLIETYPSIKNSYSKNLFIPFIEKAVKQMLKREAVLSYIVPEGLFKTRSYETCKELMFKNGSVAKIATFTDFVFDNAVTGSLIFVYLDAVTVPTRKLHFDHDYFIRDLVENDDSLLRKIEKDSSPLNSLSFLFKGMVVQDRESVVTQSKSKQHPDVFLLGKNIAKWTIPSTYYTNYKKLIIIGGTKKLDKHNHYPRILIRRTGDTLCCAFLEYPALTESTLYSCSSIASNTSDKFLFALLNSKLLNYYTKLMFITNQQGFPQILMTDLELLPIKTTKNETPYVVVVDRILATKAVDPAADVTSFETEIDHLVYELYGLTEEEIAIVEGLEAGTKRTATVAKPAKVSATRQPRKSVMTEDSDLS